MVDRNSRAQNGSKGLGGTITALLVTDFKSLAGENRIEIRPLTILAGANSSGKSSAIQPLLLLKQTLEATYDPGSLLLDGPNIRFSSVDQFLSKVAKKPAEETFTAGIEIDGDICFTSTFNKQPKGGLKLTKTTYKLSSYNLILDIDMTQQEIANAVPKLRTSPRVQLSSEWRINSKRFFLVAETELSLTGENYPGTIVLPPRIAHFEADIQRLIHVPGLRGNPERAYRTTGISPTFPGTFENYVASIINHWQNEKDSCLSDLNLGLQTLELTQLVEARQVDDVQVELRAGRLPSGVRVATKDMVNIADVGFGVSQVLPVLVALLVAEPGQMVYLEQPEIHLHPKAEVALAKVLADAAKRGVRVVAETHSDLLLLAIQTLVAEGYIVPEEVILHWFNRRKNGSTEITTAELDEAGAYGDWPEDFDIVSLKAHNRYISAAEARLMARENG